MSYKLSANPRVVTNKPK